MEGTIFETEYYRLTTGKLLRGDLQGEHGYLVTNKRTGIVEAEGLSEADARLHVIRSQAFLEGILSGEYDPLQPPGDLDLLGGLPH